VGTTDDGRVTDYGDPDATHQFRKLFAAIDLVRSPAGVVACGVEAAAAQTVCVVAMHESAQEIVRFPALLRRGHPDDRVHVVSLEHELLRCYDASVLPSEIGCPWAEPGRRVLPTLPSCFLDAGPAVSPVPGRSAT